MTFLTGFEVFLKKTLHNCRHVVKERQQKAISTFNHIRCNRSRYVLATFSLLSDLGSFSVRACEEIRIRAHSLCPGALLKRVEVGSDGRANPCQRFSRGYRRAPGQRVRISGDDERSVQLERQLCTRWRSPPGSQLGSRLCIYM